MVHTLHMDGATHALTSDVPSITHDPHFFTWLVAIVALLKPSALLLCVVAAQERVTMREAPGRRISSAWTFAM